MMLPPERDTVQLSKNTIKPARGQRSNLKHTGWEFGQETKYSIQFISTIKKILSSPLIVFHCAMPTTAVLV